MKSFRKTIKTQQVHATTDPAQPTESRDASDRFPTLKEAELLHIEEALRRAGGNQGTEAALLWISRPALNRRLSRMRGNEV